MESKIRLPWAEERKCYEIKQLIKVLLNLYKDVYIAFDDITVVTYDVWDFYKVSIFRWSKCSAGCGTKEYRDALWEHHKQAVENLFAIQGTPCPTWRFPNDLAYSGQEIETMENENTIPGVTYLILKTKSQNEKQN